MQRAHEVLYYVGLGEARYRNIETYSTGMKQRIKLAQALVHDPDLLFLDEPTNGMDPKGRDEMLELIRDLAHNKGVNLILSSHLLHEIASRRIHTLILDITGMTQIDKGVAHKLLTLARSGADMKEAAKSAGVFWKQEREFLRQARAWTLHELDRIQPDVLDADRACKQAGSPDALIAERLLLSIAGRARRLGL